MNIFKIIAKAIKFDSSVYLLAKENKSYTKYSLLIVLLASLCTGIGTSALTETTSILKEIIFSLIGWILWSFIIFIVGTKIFDYKSTFQELLRTLGIAYSPGVINILGVISSISLTVVAVSLLWTILSFIFSVKETLRCSALKAILISISGFIPYLIIKFFIFTI